MAWWPVWSGSSASHRCISRTIWRRSVQYSPVFRRCRRSPASTPRFIASQRGRRPLRDSAQLHAEGVRRYGFHGLSYEYIAKTLPQIAPAIAKRRVIVAHLGSGASMCAMKGGQSVESTMGFTALDGLPMGTRPGQLDPGVVLYLMSEKGMSASKVQDFLYRDCGLKGSRASATNA